MTELCAICESPVVMHVNGVPACSAHVFDVMDREVQALAEERGIPIDATRAALARLLREVGPT